VRSRATHRSMAPAARARARHDRLRRVRAHQHAGVGAGVPIGGRNGVAPSRVALRSGQSVDEEPIRLATPVPAWNY
jgi:hypothetical protein